MENQNEQQTNDQLQTVASQLQYCTTRIEVTLDDGRTGIGTGFFFDFPLPDGQHIPTLVTNKHVIQNSKKGSFVLHLANNDGKSPSGKTKKIELDNFASRWLGHPNNDTDICVLLLQPIFNEFSEKIFKVAVSENICLSDEKLSELYAIEDVIMVGYPRGLWDETNNFPIIRRGITASNPASDFQGKAQGVVDIAAFHGSSGSPIFIYNCGTYPVKGGVSIGNRVIFLGILYAGPIIKKSGETLISNIPVTEEDLKEVIQTVHLGYYVKAKELSGIKAFLENLMKLAQAQKDRPVTLKN